MSTDCKCCKPLSTKDFFVSICEASGVSGYEGEVAGIIREAFMKYCDEVTIDKLGNVVALKKGNRGQIEGPRPKVAFFSHMDEIGLIVLNFDKNGFLNFSSIGGYDQRTLIGQEVIIHGREKVYGVIGMRPPHLNVGNDAQKTLKLSEMLIDTGYSEERLRELVNIGDIITIKRKMTELQGDVLAGKAMDDRAGVAAMYVCAEELKDFMHDADVYFVSTTREEVGSQGAVVSTYNIEPDIGIALDVGFARTPELKPTQSCEFGKGPVIGLGPNIHPKVAELLKNAAKNNNIPYQVEVFTGNTGTDARAVQVSRTGVASGLISLPLKYMHTSVETMTMKDITATGKLLTRLITGMNGGDLEEMLCL